MYIEEIIFKIAKNKGIRIKIDKNFLENTNATLRYFSEYISEDSLSELAKARIKLELSTKSSEPIKYIIKYSGICVETINKDIKDFNFQIRCL